MISTISPETTTTTTVGTVARKRRRQIIQSQRSKANEDEPSASKKSRVELITSPNGTPDSLTVAPSKTETKKTTTKSKAKKPQMRYDPDVPMTKEEAAAWRKEQRRKRNRESAAASRQRQRDRITELEEEVSEWKLKYEEALARIEGLEKAGNCQPTDCTVSTASLSPEESAAISPCSSPRQRPVSPSLSRDLKPLEAHSHYSDIVSPIACRGILEPSNHVVKHLSEKISRPV